MAPFDRHDGTFRHPSGPSNPWGLLTRASADSWPKKSMAAYTVFCGMKSWVPSPLEPIEHVLETCLQVHTTNCNNYLWSWKFDVGHLVTLWTLLFAVFRASQRRGGLTTGDQIFFLSTYVSVLGLKHYNIHYKRKKKSSKTPLDMVACMHIVYMRMES